MQYEITDIKYDTDGEEVDLPKTLTIDVPSGLMDVEEVLDYISDEISNQTGFCHFGFKTIPEIV
jgi:hypothetical protein